MARYHEKAMVPEQSSFTSDRSAKWVTLFIASPYNLKPEKLLEVLQDIAGNACTVEKSDNDPRYASHIYKFFYKVRNVTYQGVTVAERLRNKIEAMEARIEKMQHILSAQDLLEEAPDVDQDA